MKQKKSGLDIYDVEAGPLVISRKRVSKERKEQKQMKAEGEETINWSN